MLYFLFIFLLDAYTLTTFQIFSTWAYNINMPYLVYQASLKNQSSDFLLYIVDFLCVSLDSLSGWTTRNEQCSTSQYNQYMAYIHSTNRAQVDDLSGSTHDLFSFTSTEHKGSFTPPWKGNGHAWLFDYFVCLDPHLCFDWLCLISLYSSFLSFALTKSDELHLHPSQLTTCD